jgi:hypothetical protein
MPIRGSWWRLWGFFIEIETAVAGLITIVLWSDTRTGVNCLIQPQTTLTRWSGEVHLETVPDYMSQDYWDGRRWPRGVFITYDHKVFSNAVLWQIPISRYESKKIDRASLSTEYWYQMVRNRGNGCGQVDSCQKPLSTTAETRLQDCAVFNQPKQSPLKRKQTSRPLWARLKSETTLACRAPRGIMIRIKDFPWAGKRRLSQKSTRSQLCIYH